MAFLANRSVWYVVEQLEERRLLAALSWGLPAQLAGLDAAAHYHASLTGAGQAIAVVDTGIDYTHPALGGGFGPGFKVVGGYDFVDQDADPLDTYGHGTQVAGILAADSFVHDGRLHRGVAPGAHLLALRIDDSNLPVPDQRLEQALQWVLDHRATYNITVANISFGYGAFAEAEVSTVFGDELAALKKAGVFVVASSGNAGVADGPALQYPAADPNVFSVGAVDLFGTITEFTMRSELLDLIGPGTSVATTARRHFETDPSNHFLEVTGTSFAAPFVAATAALMRQADPALQPADIRSILRASSAANIDGDDEFGVTTGLRFGRLNIAHALDLTLLRRPGLLGQNNNVAPDGNDNDLAYDDNGVLHLVYFDSADRTLKYATRSTGAAWSNRSTIDTSAEEIGIYVSLAVDAHGRPAVAYFDGNAGNLNFASFQGNQWSIETLDWKHSVGLYPSLIFDRDDHPAISYYYKSDGDLRLARFDGRNWTIQTVDEAGDVGRSTSLATDRSGNLAVAYEHSTTGHLKLARENDDRTWNTQVVDAGTRGVAWISLQFDRWNRPGISYYDAHPANLKYVRLTRGAWKGTYVAEQGAQGLYSQFVYDQDGYANLIYFNRPLNQVIYARGTFGQWDYQTLQSDGGRYLAIDLGPTGAVAYTWFHATARSLHVSDL